MAAKNRHQHRSSENGRHKQTQNSQKNSKSWKKKEEKHGTIHKSIYSYVTDIGFVYCGLVFMLAILCGVCHRNHISKLFESDRHFSHLSTLERELAFRTEMGLYFSYYKTIIKAPTFTQGLHEIMYDNVTEYGQTINTLKRFNLYPEVVLGFGYRVYEYVMQYLKIPTKLCWKVNRGQGMSPVQSCEGLGEPSYFFIEAVFLLNGINMAVFFLFGVYLSGSIFGGLLAVMSIFYNHGECTRVQWTPPLRESFAYPFHVLQMFVVTYILKNPRPNYKQSVILAIAVVAFMLPWQFAQFALLTQTVAVFGTYVLGFIGSHKLKVFLAGQMSGLAISYVLLFGNEMLLTSFFASCLVTVLVIVSLENIIEKVRIRLLIWILQGLMWLVGTLSLKVMLSKLLSVADDAHIGDIFRSKFSNFANFHTMLYTCAAEFDFMEKETPLRVLKTLLAPCAFVAVAAVNFKILKREIDQFRLKGKVTTLGVNCTGDHVTSNGKNEDNNNEEEELQVEAEGPYRSKPHAELVYHMFQLIAFTAMALIIMRLKLFWTPHLCLMTSLLASRQFFGWLGSQYRHIAVIGLIMAGMSVQGIANLQHQWSIQGEFSNMPLEEVVEWINLKTPRNAVFAGPMPTMANIKLSTGRPIVNHPHYEDAGLRERTKRVYTMYSRKPEKEVWQNHRDLKVDYIIMEESWCVRRSKPGCGMAEIWDLEDNVNKNMIPTCARIKQRPEPYFERVFRNNVYDILRVLDKPKYTKR